MVPDRNRPVSVGMRCAKTNIRRSSACPVLSKITVTVPTYAPTFLLSTFVVIYVLTCIMAKTGSGPCCKHELRCHNISPSAALRFRVPFEATRDKDLSW